MASTANVSCLSIPEAKSLRPRFLQEQFLLTAVREGLAPGRLSWLAGEGILPGLSSHCFPSTYVSSSCGFVFKDISQIGSGAHSSPACSVDQLCLILATPWTVAHQAPLSMGFFRQEYWSGLPFPTPGDVPHQGSNLGLLYCRWILYCLKHQGSPLAPFTVKFYGKQCAFSTSLSQPCCLNSLPSK